MHIGKTLFNKRSELIEYLVTRFDGTLPAYIVETIKLHYRKTEPFWFFGFSNFGGELREGSVLILPGSPEVEE